MAGVFPHDTNIEEYPRHLVQGYFLQQEERCINMKQRKCLWICLAVVAVVLAVAAAIIVPIVRQAPVAEPIQTEETSDLEDILLTSEEKPDEFLAFEPISLGNGLQIVKLGSYAGLFVEDQSDTIVSGVLQATIENTGTDNVQYMRIVLRAADGKSYEFVLTTLPAGEKVAVLEKNQAEYLQDISITSQSVEEYAVMPEAPSLHSEMFSLNSEGHTISVTNISQTTVSAGRVFYKNYVGDTYIGGITYMLSFTDLKPGETVHLTSSHFTAESSRVVFVTYAE